MGAVIESIATWRAPAGAAPTSVEMATRAASEALRDAGGAPDSIDLVISTGVFRDRNVYEPAMAPFVQAGIGANPDFQGSARGTFSFDVSNGTCGFLTGLHVAEGLIASGDRRRALVVASDATPPGEQPLDRGIPAIGAAALLSPGDDDEGVRAFETETFPEHRHRHAARGHWIRGRHLLRVEQDEGYVAACAESAERATLGFLERRHLSLNDFDLVVPSVSPAGFAEAFLARPGLEGNRGLRLPPDVEGGHTTGVACAMAVALKSAERHDPLDLLVVAAGAGVTAALLWYRIGGRERS